MPGVAKGFTLATRSANVILMVLLGVCASSRCGSVDHGMTETDRALCVAVCEGNSALVTHLLDAGADVNSTNRFGCSAIFVALKFGRTDLLKIFLSRGADPNRGLAPSPSGPGMTPLMLAAEMQNVAAVELLIKRGADVNAREKLGMTPLHYAAGTGNLRTVKLLLAANANREAK